MRLSLVTRNDWLPLVADADGRGRRCADPADQTRIVDHCALWVEHARELGVLERAPRVRDAAHAPRLARVRPARHPDVLAHDDTTCEVIADVRACRHPARTPGCARIARQLPVISLDELRDELDVDPGETAGARHRGGARAGARLSAHRDARSRGTRRTFGEPARAAARAVSRLSRAHARRVLRDHGRRAARAQSRPREPVPRGVIERMLERWTVPDPTEAHELTIHAGAPGVPTWPPTPESGTSVKG